MKMPTPLGLLKSRRFAPLFWTQFLGGFNDNFFKQAMPLYVGYRVGSAPGLDPAALTALASATFVAPFILFSALAGRLADTMDKAVLARRLKAIEVLLMSAATVALISESLPELFAVLLLLGLQAAFFGPVKYSLLPAHLGENELMLGNALIEGATFIAILIGSVVGGLLGGSPGGLSYVAAGLVAFSACGYAAARFIPPAPTADPDQSVTLNVIADTLSLLREAREQPTIWSCILGISWFWTFGAIVLALLPPLSRDVLGGTETLTSFFLAIFSVGIGAGSLICARSLRGEITPAPVPFAAIAMSVVLLVFAALVAVMPIANASDQSVAEALASPRALLLMAVLFLLSTTSGFYALPLYSILQHDAPADVKARMIGANNVANGCMLVAGAVCLSLLSTGLGLSIPQVAVILALANLWSIGLVKRLRLRRAIPVKLGDDLTGPS